MTSGRCVGHFLCVRSFAVAQDDRNDDIGSLCGLFPAATASLKLQREIKRLVQALKIVDIELQFDGR